MRSIGLLGGMSWESTQLYYQIINREIRQRCGGLHSAPMQIASLNFEDIAARQRANDWDGLARILAGAARSLESSGVECVLIGTNTMHRVAEQVRQAIHVPLIHIADTTASVIRRCGLHTVGLLGTRFTMEQPFYLERMREHGIHCLVPNETDRRRVHDVIFEELCRGVTLERSRQDLTRIIDGLAQRGIQGVILGCTELPLILDQTCIDVPLFDTTQLHALAAVDFALDSHY